MTVLRERVVQSHFMHYRAYKRLKQLSEHPVDFTRDPVTVERIDHFKAKGGGFTLLYGMERVTDEVMQALFELAQEAHAVEEMEKMQSGAVMNRIDGFPSDNRPVLHTALRDFFNFPNGSPKAQEAATLAKGEVEKLRTFMNEIDRENRFVNLVMIAIGGSDLGPRANYEALQAFQKSKRHIYFISNIDPDDPAAVIKELDLAKTLVVVVSKSGTTLETVTNEAFVRRKFVEAGLEPKEHFVAVTAKGSKMDRPDLYRGCFYMWDWVGGRFSCTSMGGGVMLAFAFGMETYLDILRGAHAMDRLALEKNPEKNLPLLLALLGIWNRNFLGYSTEAVVPYSRALSSYAAHIQQVNMESNGKRIDREGHPVDFQTCPVVWGEPGTCAQHSFFQLIHQGTATIPLELIGFREAQRGEDIEIEKSTSQEKLLANLFAQSIALANGQTSDNPNKVFPGNRPSHILLARSLDATTLGALLSLVEHKVAFQGFIWNINSFDQEGVELGKVLANRILKRFASQRGVTSESYPLGDALIRSLEQV